MKKNTLIIAIAVIFAVSNIFGVGYVVKSVNDNKTVNINVNAGGMGINYEAPAPPQEDVFNDPEFTGGFSTKSGLDTTYANLSEELIVGNTGTTTVNGVAEAWRIITFGDSTTTAFSQENPFGEEVFIFLGDFSVDYRNGTTAIAMTCGTTSLTSLTADPSDSLVDDLAFASSTLGTATTTGKTYNTNGTVTFGKSGFQDPGTNSQDVIRLGPNDRVACFLEETGTTGGITAGNNIASGTARIKFTRFTR